MPLAFSIPLPARLWIFGCILVLLGGSCKKSTGPTSYDPPNSTDTRTREIQYQVKRTFRVDNGTISVSNDFEGARLNDFVQENDSTFTAWIEPENTPINKSSWYAFKIWSTQERKILLNLHYRDGRHRYYPKISINGKTWIPLDSANFARDTVAETATLSLKISWVPLYVAGQELITSSHNKIWEDSLLQLPSVQKEQVGYSTLGKPIHSLVMGDPNSQDIVVVLGRQHPPEVTGYLAGQSFIRTFFSDTSIARDFLENYQLWYMPMLNPDGVDNGHWRHSAGGIDLNRDWEFFRQPETTAVRDYLIQKVDSLKGNIHFAIDFHSTQEDMFYTYNEALISSFPGSGQRWIDTISARLPGYEPVIEPGDLSSPSAKLFFYNQFKAEMVTYEVGDETDRTFISQKAKAAAYTLMEMLLGRKEK